MADLRSAATNADVFGHVVGDPYTLAVRAYVWGFPLVSMAWIRLRTSNPDDPFVPRHATGTGNAINRWGHQRLPADATFRSAWARVWTCCTARCGSISTVDHSWSKPDLAARGP